MRLTVKCVARPLRFAFLISAGSNAHFQRAVEINTYLWGGRYNAIVPLYRRVPSTWRRGSSIRRVGAGDVIRGHLEAFDPDYVVNLTSEPNDLVPTGRLLTPEAVTPPGRGSEFFGLTVMQLIDHLYQAEYRFERRHPRRLILPKFGKLGVLGAATFGQFPTDGDLEYFSRAYASALAAESTLIDEHNFLEAQRSTIHPLSLGSRHLKVLVNSDAREPALFLMDGRSLLDLTDYWNLRAFGWSLLCLPVQWLTASLPEISTISQQVMQRGPATPPQGLRIMVSRSLSGGVLEEALKLIEPVSEIPLVTQNWYPEYWHRESRELNHWSRCSIESTESSEEVDAEDELIKFQPPSPPFVSDTLHGTGPRWGNVIELDDRSIESNSIGVLPEGFKDVNRLYGPIGPEAIRLADEGLILERWPFRFGELWRLPRPIDVFRTWFEEAGWRFDLSGAGLVTQELIRRLGAPSRTRWVAKEPVIGLLARMSRGHVLPAGHWLNELTKHHDGRKELATRHLDFLLQASALDVGLQLQCPTCKQRTWFSLIELTSEVTCRSCLQLFPFPAGAPPREWHYKSVGPFAISGQSQGSLVSALLIAFLNYPSFGASCWTTSFVLKKGPVELEADVGMFWATGFQRTRAAIIFGECKTHGDFEPTDIARMKQLVVEFPGACIGFASLKDKLGEPEIRRLRRFAQWGRGSAAEDAWRSPIFILTKRELLSDFGAPSCWPREDPAFATVVRGYRSERGIEALADATQQLYLGMDSYDSDRRRALAKRGISL